MDFAFHSRNHACVLAHAAIDDPQPTVDRLQVVHNRKCTNSPVDVISVLFMQQNLTPKKYISDSVTHNDRNPDWLHKPHHLQIVDADIHQQLGHQEGAPAEPPFDVRAFIADGFKVPWILKQI